MTIIGLSGYAQAGKDTIGDRLVDRHGFVKLGFADALRDLMREVDPIVLWGSTWLPWNVVVNDIGYERAKKETTGREVLQRVGNGVRKVLGEDAWVEAAKLASRGLENIVFTDVRFPNEAQAITDVGGKVYRIVRHGTGPVNGHVSETALDNWAFDGYIGNNGAVEDLFGAAERAFGFGAAVGDLGPS